MNLNESLTQLETDLSLQIANAVSVPLCKSLIGRYEGNTRKKPGLDSDFDLNGSERIIAKLRPWLSKEPLNSLLKGYYQNGYQILAEAFDALSSDDSCYLSTTWHIDYGIKRSLKLFVYLNSVEEHKGNTLILDQYRTERLREIGALPVEMEKRKEDLSTEMRALGVPDEPLGYDLKAGDALLFSPFVLAHRCLLPIQGQKRYTVCFTLIPAEICL